jgi:lipopolysaccharide/colanic/teichoic acid biosynthesis glycosyltransferase
VVLSTVIKLTSKGPVLFREERVGQFGKKFIILKFRSMKISDNESAFREYATNFYVGRAAPRFKIQRDPRETAIGHFMRRTSLDELPQLLNVLVGNMSLVGPRPAPKYEVEAYELWHRRRFMTAKPGITGLAQVAKDRMPFDDSVRLDIKYAKEWSLLLDLKILLWTLQEFLFRRLSSR